MKRGVFVTDVHLPENINLKGVFDFVKDFQPHIVVFGGDIIDGKGLHHIDSQPASSFRMKWYHRDACLLKKFLATFQSLCHPQTEFIFLEGNHERRYIRLVSKYSDLFYDSINLQRDSIPDGMKVKWIPYGTYDSFYRIGDCVFLHGAEWPDSHAKKYALDHTPFKCMYGHLHHFQAYTTRKLYQTMGPRYAVTPGCLSTTAPEWKRGAPNQWVNGFASFVTDGTTTTPTVHLIEKGRFYVGRKVYQ